MAFGRASSGIVNVTTRGGSEHGHQQAELSSSDGGVLAQGQFHDGSYMLAFRRSVIDQLLPALLPDNLDLTLTTVPRYHDEQLRIDVAASYRFGRFQLGGRFRLYSGLPQTPVRGAVFDSARNLYAPIYGAVNSERAPMHHQLDLRLDRRWQWGPVKMTYFLDVQNVYLNQSAVGYIYSFDSQQRSAFRALPIVPSAGLRGEL